MGNYIGGELWGKYTGGGWGVIFPRAEQSLRGMPWEQLQAQYASGALNPLARHPSQLYEAFLEGVVMFVVLWLYSAKPRARYAVSGLFALMYGLFRFLVEFVRMPDEGVYVAFGWLTRGQILSLPLILLGLWWLLAVAARAGAAAGAAGRRGGEKGMKQYLELLRHVLEHGAEKSDRTGTGTRSVFWAGRCALISTRASRWSPQEAAPASRSSTSCCGSCRGRYQYCLLEGAQGRYLGRMGRR